MSNHYDVIVIGAGGMGSAATYHLARGGKRVLALERFDIPHTMGSSHGVNRIIRKAYFEDASYVPLLLRSYELWSELETIAGEEILVITGSVDAAHPDDKTFTRSLESCLIHGLEHEVLSGDEVNRRYPGYRLPESHMAVYQPDGGYVMSERAIVAHIDGAIAAGAAVRAREAVTGWEPIGDGVRVATERDTYTADRLVITAGAWSMGLLDRFDGLAVPERQVLAWFLPTRRDLFQRDAFPVFNIEVDEGHLYGFPEETIPGFKIGIYHHLFEDVDPDLMDREPTIADEQALRAVTERYFPEAAGAVMSLKSCLFTNSPDEHFIVDTLPDSPQVAVAAGFSGHGYKFASVIGEILADLAIDGGTTHDIELLRLGRFA
jgi:sarcosine oxidase